MEHFDTDIDDLVEFDFADDIDGFEFDTANDAAIDTDIVKIRRYPRPKPHLVKYERAADLAKKMPDLAEGEAVFSIVSGNFIFGDFIEALMVEKNYFADEIIVATLSLGQENVDSLQNLVDGGFVDKLSLIVSDFWYAHERRTQRQEPTKFQCMQITTSSITQQMTT